MKPINNCAPGTTDGPVFTILVRYASPDEKNCKLIHIYCQSIKKSMHKCAAKY